MSVTEGANAIMYIRGFNYAPELDERKVLMAATPLLFEKYPELQDRIPWIKLGDFPTPVEEMKGLENELKHSSLWIKRDDLSGEKYGGNKIRKLEFILADLLRKKKKWIMTFGGLGSNHGLATAIYAREHGIKTVLGLIDQPVTEHVQKQLLRFHHFGAKISYAKNAPGAVLKGLWHLVSKRGVYSFYGPGGSNKIRNLGFVEAAFELAKQVESGIMPKPEKIYLPIGSMGTYAGLAVGLKLAGMETGLVGVRVADIGMTNEKKTARMINKTFKYLGEQSDNISQVSVSPEEVNINHDFVGPCYGAVTKESLDAIQLIGASEGIHLDTTYSGKALACMLKHIQDDKNSKGPILFWNTYSSVNLDGIGIKYEEHKQLPKSFHRFFREDLMSHH